MIITTLLSFLIGAMFLLPVLRWYKYVHQCEKYLKHIPGPTPWPVIGNALMFLNFKNESAQVVDKIFKKYGKIVKFWIGVGPVVLLADYKSIESVLSSTKLLDKSKLYKFMQSSLGAGLITSSGTKWAKRRRMITPAFHFQIVKQFLPTFNEVSNTLVEELRKVNNKDCVDIHPYMTLAALDVICETAMGVSVNALQNKEFSYVKSVQELSRILMDRALSVVQQNDFLFQLSTNGYIERESLKILHDHTMSVIKKRRKELPNKNREINEEDEYGNKRKVAFLDMLLQTSDNGIPLSDDDIREEVDTFMAAGHHTAASALSFACFEIANHPEVQEKIVQEQFEIFGNENREATYNDLSSMRYLEMVIKEILRLYPPVPNISREAVEDTQITDDLCVPKGTTIAIMIYQMHRDPTYFPEPEKFDPDRFLSENSTGSYSFIPFSAGPRNCVGQKFAYLEMKVMISKIVRHFELSAVVPAHELQLVGEIVLKSKNGTLIKIRERT